VQCYFLYLRLFTLNNSLCLYSDCYHKRIIMLVLLPLFCRLVKLYHCVLVVLREGWFALLSRLRPVANLPLALSVLLRICDRLVTFVRYLMLSVRSLISLFFKVFYFLAQFVVGSRVQSATEKLEDQLSLARDDLNRL